MQLDWNAIGFIAAIVLPVVVAGMVFWRWFDSRPHRFKDFDGNEHIWHPGGRFTDLEGRTVTDPRRIETLRKAWDDWRNPPGQWGS